MMLSKIVVTVAKKRNETTAYSSRLLPVAMTVPVRIWLSLGISRPTSVIASATSPKDTRSRVVRQETMYFSRSFSFSSRRGRGR